MPAPPITIGELTDVPAFNSPIASPWAQEVSRRVVHRFASTAERDAAYPAAIAGAGAVCEVAAVPFVSNGVAWIGRTRIAGTIFAPTGPGSGGSLIPGDANTYAMCRVTIPFACNVRLDLTAFLSGDAQWSAYFNVLVAGVQRFFMAASSVSSTTLDVHPFFTVTAGQVIDVTARYGVAGTGRWQWYSDPGNIQFTAECGQA